MNSLGRHILVEFFGCSSEILNNVSVIESSMLVAAQEAGATVINSTFHHLKGYKEVGHKSIKKLAKTIARDRKKKPKRKR